MWQICYTNATARHALWLDESSILGCRKLRLPSYIADKYCRHAPLLHFVFILAPLFSIYHRESSFTDYPGQISTPFIDINKDLPTRQHLHTCFYISTTPIKSKKMRTSHAILASCVLASGYALPTASTACDTDNEWDVIVVGMSSNLVRAFNMDLQS